VTPDDTRTGERPVVRVDEPAELVRLRYRRVQGQPRVNWTATVYQREEVLATAYRELVAHIATETGVPVFLGEPPSAR